MVRKWSEHAKRDTETEGGPHKILTMPNGTAGHPKRDTETERGPHKNSDHAKRDGIVRKLSKDAKRV